MTSKRLHLIMIAVVGLLFISLLVGAYGTNKMLTAEAGKLTGLKAKSLALNQEQVSLAKAKKDIKKYAALEKIAHAVVPEDKNQAEAVREIINIAAANNISIASISFPASTLGNTPTAGSSAPAAANVPPKAAGNTKVDALSQLLPVKTIPGVYQLLISVNGEPQKPVQYDKFLNFLKALENNRRTSQVSTITLKPDANNHDYLTFSLTLNEYIKP